MTVYDYIIYGSTLSGIIYAIQKKRKGKLVMLVNPYGFLGGSITESLNIFQSAEGGQNLFDGYTTLGRILLAIKNEKHGILFYQNNEMILNPESVKYILQKEVEEFKIELLFHVQPYRVERNELFTLSLLGREGEIKLQSKSIVDASDNFLLTRIYEKRKSIIKGARLNVVTTGKNEIPDELFEPVLNRKRLNDRRYWISLDVEIHDNLFIESYSQKKLDEFSHRLREIGERVQIVPAQTFLQYSIEKKITSDEEDNFISIVDLFKNDFSESEELIKAQGLEKIVSNE